MRQAVTTIIAGLSLAFSPVAQANGDGTDAAAVIAQAKRLIDAKDYPPATILLEDLLPDADVKQRPAILELLGQSYEVMAREAKAAGRDREAAEFQENLAIIARARGKTTPPKPGAEKPGKPVAPPPPANESKTSGTTGTVPSRPPARNVSLIGSALVASPASPPEPASIAEPAKMPAPGPLPLLPQEVASPASADSSPPSKPTSAPRTDNDSGREQGDTAATESTAAGVGDSKSLSVVSPQDNPTPPDDPKPAPAGPTLEEADRFFATGKYEDAGRCYAALARANHLPPHRKEHWAYCRMVEIARQINRRPRTARDWDDIEKEIISIQRLTPNIWYGEYLRSKVAEVRRAGRRLPAKSDNLVVRATEPDENQSQPEPPSRRLPRLFGKSRAAANAQPAATPVAALPSAEVPLNLPGDSSQPPNPLGPADGQGNDRVLAAANGPAAGAQPGQQGPAVSRAGDDSTGDALQVYETANFRIYHRDARLAQAAGQAAEAVRAAQAKRWASPAGETTWTPACELYLYPSGKVFARETKQPEESPGFSTMACNGNRVVARRVNLRADHPQMVTAILPHEVTHIVLADLFTTQQIPRWADEGLAVLAEPRNEQQIRAAELERPLQAGRVFELSKLMAMDYPEAKDWSLYYAQSVSLTRFLVEQGPPEKFVQFVQKSQRDGIEGALRDTYRITGFADLQERWATYARQQLTQVRTAIRNPRSQPEETEVK